MVEEETQQNQPVETKPKDKIEAAREQADRLENLSKEVSEKIARLEQLRSEEILGGTTQGGKPVVKEEEKPEDYAKKALEGSL